MGDLLAAPEPGSAGAEAYAAFVEAAQGDAAVGLRAHVACRLADITACGHLADTLLARVYPGGAAAAAAAAAAEPINAVPLRERPAALAAALASRPDAAFTVRIEVDDCHVFLLDALPVGRGGGARGAAGPHAPRAMYRLESLIGNYDGRVMALGGAEYAATLTRGRVDVFEVRMYDPAGAAERVGGAVRACFGAAALDARVPVGSEGRRGRWEDVGLELVHRVRSAAAAALAPARALP